MCVCRVGSGRQHWSGRLGRGTDVRTYFKNGKVKVELALAKGKQLWDKRETERRRTADKEAREAIRDRKK